LFVKEVPVHSIVYNK